ncbi:MAG: hypothetical protein SCH39_13295 [Methanosarcinales archaeon]|nr:hypothetical protein [Methanosarcinales archaeon]
MENKMVFSSPKKTVDNNLTRIEKGQGSKKIVVSLKKALKEDPELIEDTALALIRIIQTDKKETFGYCLEILLNIAETETELLVNSIDAFIKIIQIPDDNALDINSILIALDILSIIVSVSPDLMQPAVPELLKKMRSSNSQIRSASYYILDTISKSNPEFFSNYTLDLIRSLNGLNVDERIYAIKLIGEIAQYSPKVIDDSYNVLKDLSSKHPSLEIRQQAHDVLKKFSVDEATPEVKTELLEFEKDFIGLNDINSEEMDFAELADDLSERIKGIDFEASAVAMLKSLEMDHLIVEPEYRTHKTLTKEVEETIQVNEDTDEVNAISKKLQTNLEIETELHRIEQLVMDPIIELRLSPVEETTQKDETKYQEHPSPEFDDDKEKIPETKAEVTENKADVMENKAEVTEIKSDVMETKAKVTEIKADVTETKAKVTEIKADVTKTKAEVTEIKADVSETKADVTKTKAEVTEIKADVSETKADVTKTKAEVTEIKADVSETKADVSETKADVTKTKAEVTEIKSDVSETKAEVTKIRAEVTEIKAGVKGTKIVDQGFTQRAENNVETILAPLPDISIEMVHAIFSALQSEDRISNIGLIDINGKLITAIDPGTMNSNLMIKIIDMLSLEECLTQKEGFRNRVSIELSDKVLVAMPISTDHIMVVFTRPDVQFGMVFHQLDRTADKLEQILT